MLRYFSVVISGKPDIHMTFLQSGAFRQASDWAEAMNALSAEGVGEKVLDKPSCNVDMVLIWC